VGNRVRVAGMRQFWRRSTTRRGELIYIMSLEDLDGMLNVLILANVYQRCRAEISGAGPFIVEGTIELDQERSEPFIRADRILRLD
jgi:DNA polymerase III alpha subunit